MNIHTGVLGESNLHGYVAEPEVRSTAGVLVLPTNFGVNQFAREYATHWLAAACWLWCGTSTLGLVLSTEYQECIRRPAH